MLTRYLHYNLYPLLFLFFNISIFCNDSYISDWGDLSIKNQSLTIQNEEIITVVNNHIAYMNSIFGNIRKVPFTIIISNKDNKLYKQCLTKLNKKYKKYLVNENE